MVANTRPFVPRVEDESTRSALTQAHDLIDRLQATVTTQTASITTLQGLTARVATLETQVQRLDALVRRLTGLV